MMLTPQATGGQWSTYRIRSLFAVHHRRPLVVLLIRLVHCRLRCQHCLVSPYKKDSSVGYVSSCGIPLMPVVYQVVGFGRGDGASRHLGRDATNTTRWENMTSSVIPKIHNVSQHLKRRTEPRWRYRAKLVKIGRGVPKICSRTDTHGHADTIQTCSWHLRSDSGAERAAIIIGSNKIPAETDMFQYERSAVVTGGRRGSAAADERVPTSCGRCRWRLDSLCHQSLTIRV